MKVDLYTQKGEKSGTLDLPKEIFDIPFNKDLVHQALVMQLGNQRSPIAHTLEKGEVRGGGRKPFKQKGTGSSRQGSIRNPHYKGGGVAFGPRNVRNFVRSIPKKQRRKALFCALSEKVRSNQVIGLESYKADKPKTKEFAAMLKKLPVKRNALFVISEKDNVLLKSSRNISNLKTVLAGYINIQDLQKYETVILLKDAVAKLKETFLSKK